MRIRHKKTTSVIGIKPTIQHTNIYVGDESQMESSILRNVDAINKKGESKQQQKWERSVVMPMGNPQKAQ